jgi:hypothetical protein
MPSIRSVAENSRLLGNHVVVVGGMVPYCGGIVVPSSSASCSL